MGQAPIDERCGGSVSLDEPAGEDAEGVVYYTRRGEAVQLGPVLNRGGGEGKIYVVSLLRVAKIFHNEKRDAEREFKILAMIDHPPRDVAWASLKRRSIAWPIEALYEQPCRRHFVGYTMWAIDTRRYKPLDEYFGRDSTTGAPAGGWTYRHRLTAARNLMSLASAIWAAGHRIGDVHPGNFLFSGDALAAVVDTDSFEIHVGPKVFPSRVGTPENSPPELRPQDLARSSVNRTDSDAFGLAIQVFRLLQDGVHPFAARGSGVGEAGDWAAKIDAGLYPYANPVPGVLEPPAAAPPISFLPETLRVLFHRAFATGLHRPTERPGPVEWMAALHDALSRVVTCPNGHTRSSHVPSCSDCTLAAATPRSAPMPRRAPRAKRN